jgi:hypothetical protein
MMKFERPRLALAAAVLAVCLPCGAAFAQDNAKDLDDFIHYTNVAKPELASQHLRRLLNSGITDGDLSILLQEVDRARFENALRRARGIDGLRDVVAELETRLRSGASSLARDTNRIDEAVKMLAGTLRQQQMANNVLRSAGEYAVPRLLQEVTDGADAVLRQRCVDALINEIGPYAVTPLSEALLSLDAVNQSRVSDILARIGYTHAGPYLAELAADSSASQAARESAARAARTLGASPDNLSNQLADLGRRYLTGGDSLVTYPGEPTNNVWRYDAHSGLLRTEVPTEIYSEVMAMRLARKALKYDPSHSAALATYIAANLKRENELPQGGSDPVFGSSNFTPDFFAMAAGPTLAQDVLALSLDMNDTPLVRDAIRAMSTTTGGANLFSGGGRRPLVECLLYPDRRVRYDAALALGGSLPSTGFENDFQVVPQLAGAVRAGGANYALVIADDAEDQTLYRDRLTTLGYDVMATAASVGDVRSVIASSPGVDVIVTRQALNGTQQTIAELRLMARTSVAPVVALVDALDVEAVQDAVRNDRRVVVRSANLTESAFAAIVDDALLQTSGGRISEAEAMAYSFESIATLYNIAISNSNVFTIADAESSLVSALGERTGNIRLKIADVLACIDSESAQYALFDAAFASTDSAEQIELLKRVATSARKYGNRANESHVSRLLDLVKQGGDIGQAAARVHGALNLPAENVVRIIAD